MFTQFSVSFYLARVTLVIVNVRDAVSFIILFFLLVGSFVASIGIAAMLGKKIATDPEFRKRFVPSWYDFTVSKPKSAWTRAEFHEQMVQTQRELHERAIRGDFSKEKLDSLRRHFEGVDPEEDDHGWGKLHPGVDDDEDIED